MSLPHSFHKSFDRIDLVLSLFFSWTALGLLILLFYIPFCKAENMPVSSLKKDEALVFFPSYGSWEEHLQSWIFTVRGVVFEPETDSKKRKVFVYLLSKILQNEPEENEIFKSRIQPFLVDNERSKSIVIQIERPSSYKKTLYFTLEDSSSNGHFQGTITLKASDLGVSPHSHTLPTFVSYKAILKEGDSRVFKGEICLIPPQGISVISDIDDTIKISNVLDKKALLRNTFLKAFEPAPAMANLYQKLAQRHHASFHYVSSSPWQLFETLHRFLQEFHFPQGTFHLKHFRLKDSSLLELFAPGDVTKPKKIEPLFLAFPQRQFILIGDSGEEDPEVYGEIARRFPQQVLHLWIRDVTQEPENAPRYLKAFKDIPRHRWQLFSHPETLQWE